MLSKYQPFVSDVNKRTVARRFKQMTTIKVALQVYIVGVF